MARSWNTIRKELEQNYLCEKLQGRVQYFLTHYHNAHDEHGRFCVRVDGEEIVFANPYNEGWQFHYANQLQKERNIPRREWTGKGKEFLHDEENRAIEEEAFVMAAQEGKLTMYDITNAIQFYLDQDIKKSVSSENPVIRMFAVLDRRVGKRTLVKMQEELEKQPEWLQKIYCLRFEVEKM